MSQSLSRREFLKLSSMFLLSLKAPSLFAKPSTFVQNSERQNILIIVFDTFSAKNVHLYGYPRLTTPNLDRIASKATVYHNHFAGGLWTYPGTATLLTGVYPWTHRALHQSFPIVSPYSDNNLFSLLPEYNRIAYTHNPFAHQVLQQFISAIDTYHPLQSLFVNNDLWLSQLFSKDINVASLSWERTVKNTRDGTASSLFFSNLYQFNQDRVLEGFRDDFPVGPPSLHGDNYFLLNDAIEWIQTQTLNLPQPYLGYFHLLPPHAPYTPSREFFGTFDGDGYKPIKKPIHFLKSEEKYSESRLQRSLNLYDEYILNVDAELGRLYDFMETNGVLENTWVIITSDHGEMFERGIRAHRQPTFHQPVIRVPLIILEPGNKTRRDITTPTTAVDLLPTLLNLTGNKVPEFIEGHVLPPFGGVEDLPKRSVFALDARRNDQRNPLIIATAMLVKDGHKLSYYFGYPENPDGKPVFELFDLENDPEELTNLYSKGSGLSAELEDELLETIREKDAPYA